jgi:hypothetical protein
VDSNCPRCGRVVSQTGVNLIGVNQVGGLNGIRHYNGVDDEYFCTKVVNKNTEPYDVYIGRGSKWGNPFRIGLDGDRTDVIKLYRAWLYDDRQAALLAAIKPELKGKVLGCFCKPAACHGDVLAEIADAIE